MLVVARPLNLQALSATICLGMFERIRRFFGELGREFKRINWPSLNEAVRLSAVVIVISLLVAAFLGALDFAFVWILQNILG